MDESNGTGDRDQARRFRRGAYCDGREKNSNFGFNLPWWDYLFGTYRDQPEAGHLGMTIGIEDFRTERDLRLDRLLIQLFRRDDRAHPNKQG